MKASIVRVSLAAALLWAAQAGAQAPGVQVGPGGVKVTGADGKTVEVNAASFRGAEVGDGSVKVGDGSVKVGDGSVKVGAAAVAKGGAQDPVTCNGNQALTFDGVKINNASGPAIRASGNCSITAKNCTLEGSSFAVESSGNASIVLEGCKLTGKEKAIKASGNSSVVVTASELTGGVKRSGNAVVSNGGGSKGL